MGSHRSEGMPAMLLPLCRIPEILSFARAIKTMEAIVRMFSILLAASFLEAFEL